MVDVYKRQLTYSLTILGIDTNLQFVFSGIIILVAVTPVSYTHLKTDERSYYALNVAVTADNYKDFTDSTVVWAPVSTQLEDVYKRQGQGQAIASCIFM